MMDSFYCSRRNLFDRLKTDLWKELSAHRPYFTQLIAERILGACSKRSHSPLIKPLRLLRRSGLFRFCFNESRFSGSSIVPVCKVTINGAGLAALLREEWLFVYKKTRSPDTEPNFLLFPDVLCRKSDIQIFV